MKRTTFSPLSIIIIAMLLVCFAIPVMASTISGSGTSDSGYAYRYSFTNNSTSSVAYIVTPYHPSYVTATAANDVKDPVTGSDTTITDTRTGYVNVTATAGNTLKSNGKTYTVQIESSYAILKVGNEVVVDKGDFGIG